MTLEWSIPSPPPVHNFDEIPTVHSRDAHWEAKYGNEEHGGPVPVAGGAESEAAHDEHAGGGGHSVHLPGLSYYPIMIALGLTATGYGVIFHDTLTWALAAIGAGVAIVGTYAWSFEPASEEPEQEHS